MRSSSRGRNINGVFLEARFLEARKERARSDFFFFFFHFMHTAHPRPTTKLLQIREAGEKGRKERYLYTYIVTIAQDFENVRFQES